MKTQNTETKIQNSGLLSRPEQVSTEQNISYDRTPAPCIDFARRQANRQLATQDLLTLLRTEAPRFYELAEVVGKWVWIQFTDKQPPQITTRLAEFGFHWNIKRQVWQNPCGPVSTAASLDDPRAKYCSHHPADLQLA